MGNNWPHYANECSGLSKAVEQNITEMKQFIDCIFIVEYFHQIKLADIIKILRSRNCLTNIFLLNKAIFALHNTLNT